MEHKSMLSTLKMSWPTVSICVGFFLGSCLGCLFVATPGGSSPQLREFLQDYVSSVGAGETAPSVLRVIWCHGRWFLACICLLYSDLAHAALPVLFVGRGFLLGFCVGCFIRFLDITGLFLALIVFGLPALFWMPALLWLGRTKGRVLGRTTPTACERTRLRCSDMLIVAVLFLLCVFTECSLLPALLPPAVRILG